MTVSSRMVVYISVVLMSCVWRPGETFIFDTPSQCVVAPPCTCSGSYNYCNSKSLTSIPTIKPFPTTTSSTLYLYLSSNKISNVSANAFRNVTSANATRIYMYLNINMITSISDQAFNGIENQTTLLQLESNKLTSIPSAIGHLVNLQTLYLRNNPLQTLDAQVLAKIHGSLHTLIISFGNMTSWPREIHVLRELQYLTIDHINLRALPLDAFHGFETSLNSLSLAYTDLERIPENICNLKHLRSFTFDSNSMFNGNISLQNLCHAPFTEVTSLYLRSDSIYQVPDGIFATFPHLTTLDLSGNKLRYIPYASVPFNNQVSSLYLNNNLFYRIPSAVSRFQRLQTLQLNGNQIISIEHNDLVSLLHLSSVYLSSNPLEYIDPNAFRKQQTSLTNVDLSYSQLDTIPSAVTSLLKLSSLSFYKNPRIECSCDNMSHLRSWNVTGVNINAYNCEFTTESIKDYIMTSLAHCPVK